VLLDGSALAIAGNMARNNHPYYIAVSAWLVARRFGLSNPGPSVSDTKYEAPWRG
jgi:hypothetical protein